MAGDDKTTALLIAAALGGGIGIPAVANSVDVYTGDTHGLNSGEIPLNLLIGAAPMTAGIMGGTVTALADPYARAYAFNQAAKNGKDQAVTPERARQVMEWMDLAAKAQEREASLSREDAMRMIERKGGRRLWGGIGLSSLAAAIPAVIAMRDQPAEPGVI